MRSIRKLAIFNPYGRLDPQKPFAPFGNQPGRGSHFSVGSRAFLKPGVRKVRIGIAWHNLSPTFNLANHFAGYPGPISASSFKVAATFLTGGQWQPLDLVDSCLFNRETRLGLASRFDLELPERFAVTATPSDDTVDLNFDQNTFEGFFRFELIEPEFGFGAAVYSNLLSEALLANARVQVDNLLPSLLFPNPPTAIRPLPNPPFTPLARGVSILYVP